VVSDSKPYGFSAAFERELAVALLTRPVVYGHLGPDLDPSRFTSGEDVRLGIKIARLYASEHGRGPSSSSIAYERARLLVHGGKLTQEELDDLGELLSSHDRLPSDDDLVATAVVVLRRDLEQAAILKAMELHGARKDVAPALEGLKHARELGRVDKSTGLKLGLGALDSIRRLRQADRLPTPCLELDFKIGGGLPRGKAAIIAMTAKGGKSFWLTGQSGVGLQRGLFVACATLELSEEDQSTRLISLLSTVPIDDITAGARDAEVEERLEALLPTLGIYRVKFFPARITHFGHIVRWIEDIEQEEGQAVDLLVMDYLDKVGSTNPKHVSAYEIQGQAAEDFRLYVYGRGLWGWSASQPKRKDASVKGSRRLGIDDLADSQEKVRVMDLIVTGHRPAEGQVELYVPGSRISADGFTVGPFAMDLARAQFIAAYNAAGGGEPLP
jgi:hypothetical protein